MGTVHLTNGHHGLYIRNSETDFEKRVLLDSEMLSRPIYNGSTVVQESTTSLIRGALQGLMDLTGFNAAVSYCVVKQEGVPHLMIPHRIWGEITLDNPKDVVLAFSHDSRRDNYPYSALIQWLEEEYPDRHMSSDEYNQFCSIWSSPEKWRQVFENRIRREIDTIRSKSDSLLKEAESVNERANVIETALG